MDLDTETETRRPTTWAWNRLRPTRGMDSQYKFKGYGGCLPSPEGRNRLLLPTSSISLHGLLNRGPLTFLTRDWTKVHW